MAIYRVGCGLCGNDNIHEANSDEESLQKHNDSNSHIEKKAAFDAHMSNFIHGKDHN